VLKVVALTVVLVLCLQQMSPNIIGLELLSIFEVQNRIELLLNTVVVRLDNTAHLSLTSLKKQGWLRLRLIFREKTSTVELRALSRCLGVRWLQESEDRRWLGYLLLGVGLRVTEFWFRECRFGFPVIFELLVFFVGLRLEKKGFSWLEERNRNLLSLRRLQVSYVLTKVSSRAL
jgi:hypothetical protein